MLFEGGTGTVVAGDVFLFPNILNPDKDEMLHYLNLIERKRGDASLIITPEPDVDGPRELIVRGDGVKYLLHMSYYENNDYDVWIPDTNTDEENNALAKECGGKGLAVFNGSMYPVQSVIKDFNVVRRAFVEFLETGEISFFY